MNLEAIMDDIDAQLRLENAEPDRERNVIDEIRRVMVRQSREQVFSLVAPILGHDFVSGFDESTANWLCLQSFQIEDLRFESEADMTLPKLRRRSICLADFLQELPKPTAIQLQLADLRVVNTAFTHVEGEFLFVGNSRAISLRSLLSLRLLESTDLNELQEWRDR
jgi:hypothetical protein